MAEVGIAAGVNKSLPTHAEEPSLGMHDHSKDAPVFPNLHVAEPRVKEHLHASRKQQAIPDKLEALRVVGHAGAGSVGIGSKENVAGEIKRVDNAIRDAADDLARLFAGCEESIECVKDLRACSAGEAIALDQHHRSAHLSGGNRSATASAAGTDDYDVGGAHCRNVGGDFHFVPTSANRRARRWACSS